MNIYTGNSSFFEYNIVKSDEKTIFLIVENEKRAKECLVNLKAYRDFFNRNTEISFFPSSKNVLDLASQIERNHTLMKILKGKENFVVIPKDALNVPIRSSNVFLKNLIYLEKSVNIDRDKFIEKLYHLGYIRTDFPENEGEFSVKGGFISINIPKVGIVDIDLFGDFVENIFLKSKLLTRREIQNITIFSLYDFNVKSQNPLTFYDEEKSTILEYIKGSVYTLDIYEDLGLKVEKKYISKFTDKNIGTEKDIDKDFKIYYLPLKKSLILKEEKVAFIPSAEEKISLDVEPLKEGDYIVHEDFGIGIYRGIESKEIRGKLYDFMILEYAEGEKIYVSYLHFDKIHKYKTSGHINLDKIGGTSWRNLKKKVKESLKNVAKDLIKVYSQRQSITRRILKVDDPLIDEFERTFEYVETQDQLKAIKEVKEDLSKSKPMERLICGDVGFGKTEVAIRSSFIMAVNGYQTLVLVPTTVLSYQHYKKFKSRLEPFSIVVENLSRLKTKKESEEIIRNLEEGKIDVIIATHKILQDNIKFKNLGLLIIDEEHRFGVRAKERIRQLKSNIDTLYLTATPIPRTLNMALSGLKDISIINTPPEGRYEIKTYVSEFNDEFVKKAIKFELERNGQVFYLHNRVETIKERVDYIKNLIKDANIDFIHGKMKPSEIEKRILNFINGEIDILVSTSIIETGVDIPTANTLIVERADLFGLAQLYHLRGRVGRGNVQAYCYLFVPKNITGDAKKRIDTLLRLTRPGSGLKISIEDMNIRGPGNILGVEQSGFINKLGFQMYLKLLKETIREEKGYSDVETEIDVDFDYYIPQDFIKDPSERLNIYMAVSQAESFEEIERLRKYLKEFYTELPQVFNFYLIISEIKKMLSEKKVKKFFTKKYLAVLYFSKDTEPDFILKLVKYLNPIKIESDKIYFNLENLEKFLNILKM